MSIPLSRPSANIHIISPDDLDEEVTREILTSGVPSSSTVDLGQFKDGNGEFKKWLHIFQKAYRGQHMLLRVTTVLPWCSPEDTVDVGYHRAVTALNGYAKYPLNWRSFSWQMEPLITTPTYGVFCSNPAQRTFFERIAEITGKDASKGVNAMGLDFWEKLVPYVLVPSREGNNLPVEFDPMFKPLHQEKIDENSGLGEAGAESLRER